MRDGFASPSALRVAALRALHQTIDSPGLFVDPLAVRILGPEGEALVASYRATAASTGRLRGTLAVRAMIAEEAIEQAADRGVHQCVILGAGLDTFAYRHALPALEVFEVDHPDTQIWKRERLHAAGIEIPPSVRYVTLDLERDDLFAALEATGFDAMRSAVFVMLGVVPYLTRDALLALLRRLGAADDVEIVFDYTEPYHDAPPDIRRPYEAVASRLAAEGEPWVTLLEPGPLHQALRDRGFRAVTDLDAAALHHRFLAGRTDDLSIAALVHLVRARAHRADGADCIHPSA